MSEMTKLRKALDSAGIKWQDYSSYTAGAYIERTRFINKYGEECSVICGDWTYGGPVLLESMPPVNHYGDDFKDEVEGYLEADEIIAAWI
jgi:hypothetical protein